ncbi:MAG: MOSC domain-containing protein [Gammaproteobacteria bacterium]|nr:MOSC domain-containing protein [Gammaproteobacteria bacterium]
MTSIFVSDLSIYPLKSCREIKKNSSRVEEFGLKNDRRWMVVDEHGVMLTQRKIAKMCLIQPELTDSGLVLKAVNMDNLAVEIPPSSNNVNVKVWEDFCNAYDAGNEAASWLSQVLSTRCRLVYFPDNEFRQVDLDYANEGDKTAFSDGFPLLLISQASLDDLNQRLSTPVTMNRFRPNIVIAGCQPFAEDSWKKIRIGDITFRIVKPCSRCVIPSINIETAEREDEPTKTLARYRKRDNKIFFGQNVIADGNGNIDVGMSVEIIEK